MFIFFLEAGGSFNVSAASKVQAADGGRRASVCMGTKHPSTRASAPPAQLTATSLLLLGFIISAQPLRSTSSSWDSFPTLASPSCSPCFFSWTWTTSKLPCREWGGLSSWGKLLTHLLFPTSIFDICYLRIKVLISEWLPSFVNLLQLSLQQLRWFLYGGNFLCPGETEIEGG